MKKAKNFILKKLGISFLKAENKQRKTENDRLKVENEQRKAENEQLQKALDAIKKESQKEHEYFLKTLKILTDKVEVLQQQYQDEQKNSQKYEVMIEKLQEKAGSNANAIAQLQKNRIFDSAQRRNLEYKLYKYMWPEKYELALCDWYFERTGKNLDLQNPKTFNEIIQWTKLYDMPPEKVKLVDKYLVRDWVKEKIGEKYLIPLLGVWDKAADIDFHSLPDQFVLKCNHGCGYNIIVTDKHALDEKQTITKLNHWMNEDFAFRNGFELQYSSIERKIIAEKYIENNHEDLFDYKVFCFNGKAKYVMFLSNRKHGLTMQFYDLDWNLLPMSYSYARGVEPIQRPDNLEELILCAEKLAAGFIQVRVDFYRLNDGSLKFGEMTFTSASGLAEWDPEECDAMLGSMITLPEK